LLVIFMKIIKKFMIKNLNRMDILRLLKDPLYIFVKNKQIAS